MAKRGNNEYHDGDYHGYTYYERMANIDRIIQKMDRRSFLYLDKYIEKSFSTVDKIEKSIEKFDDWHFDLPEKPSDRWFKTAYSRIARNEIMVPAQQSLEARWLEEEQYFTREYEDDSALDEWAMRHRLGWSAFNGVGYGSMSAFGSYVILGMNGLAGLALSGSAAVAGAGYGWYETRKNKDTETENKLQVIEDPRQLTDVQIDQVERMIDGVGWAGSNIWHGRHRFKEQDLADVLSVVGGESTGSKAETLLDWIDDKRSKKVDHAIGDGTYGDGGGVEPGLVKLIAFYQVQGLYDMKDTYELSPYQSVPLYMQALVRMNDRQPFMTEFAYEFDDLEDKIAREYELNNELNQAKEAADNIGSSAYYELKINQLSEQCDELESEIILHDIRLASLAYAYDNSRDALKNYAPRDSELFESSQLEQWQKGIDELSTIDTSAMDSHMSNLLMLALNECISIEPGGRYGSAVCEVASYIRRVSDYVRDEESATEALGQIRTMLRV